MIQADEEVYFIAIPSGLIQPQNLTESDIIHTRLKTQVCIIRQNGKHFRPQQIYTEAHHESDRLSYYGFIESS
jgi:hypothetical protein